MGVVETTSSSNSNSFLCYSDFMNSCQDPEQHVIKKQIIPYAELVDVEQRRRNILKRTELPLWRILCYWEGTCLRAMSVDWLLWVTVVVYVSIRIALRCGNVLANAVDLGNTDISVIGGFLSFFLVLFVNQSNSRFHDMYKTSQKCPSRIYDIAQMVTTSFPKHAASRLVRYLNAAHVAGYVGLSRTYSKQEFFDILNNNYQFLSKEELKRINEVDMDYSPDAFHELVSWCMNDIEKAYTSNWIDAREKSALKEKTTQFRNSLDELHEYTDQPIHFFYVHFLCLLSTVYLPLFAADNAYNAGTDVDDVHWSWDVLSALIVLVQAIFVIGLRLLGQKMADPFGDDVEDLSVLHYITETWQRSNRMLAAKCPEESSPDIELELAKERKMTVVGTGYSAPKPSSAAFVEETPKLV